MKKLILTTLLLSLFSNSSFAYTERTKSDLTYSDSYEYFREKNHSDYNKLSIWERRGMITQSLLGVTGSCLGSAAGSVLLYIGNSIPILSLATSTISGALIEHHGHHGEVVERLREFHEGKGESSLFIPLVGGGVVSTIADIFISGFDALDGKIDDQAENEQNTHSFQNAKIVYSVPTELAIALLDEDSMCAESLYEVILLSEISFGE